MFFDVCGVFFQKVQATNWFDLGEDLNARMKNFMQEMEQQACSGVFLQVAVVFGKSFLLTAKCLDWNPN